MAKHSVQTRRETGARKSGHSPISYKPGKGLAVSLGHNPFPETSAQKIMVAKSIVQACIAAHDSGNLDGANYDVHWPLSMAVQLLEQANAQLDTLEIANG